ncbi:MAG: hypothetical protein M0002_13825 [Rhodospirillales bacterium]|nr:hypothetical protein [Rhodospirillales bacterium]
MVSAYRDIGGIAASFSVVDEFSGPLQLAADQIGEVQKAIAGAATSAATWASAMARVGASMDAVGPGMVALADGLKKAMPAMQGGMADVAYSAAALDGSVGAVAVSLRDMGAAGAGLSAPFTKAAVAAGRLDAALTSADDRMTVLADKSAAVAASSKEAATATRLIGRGAGGVGAAAGGGGGGGKGGGIFGAVKKGGEPARKFFHVPGMAALGGMFVGYEAVKSALKTDYSVRAAALLYDPTARHDPKQLAHDVRFLRELSFRTAQGTIYTAQETAAAYGTIANILRTAPKFQGKHKFPDFASVAPILLRASEVASMQSLGSLSESAKAMVMYAHLTGAYTPAATVRRTNQMLAMAEVTGMKMPALERVMSYGLPIIRALGGSMSQGALLTAFLAQAGLGRRAGYAVGQMASGLLQTGGPLTAALEQQYNSAQKALGKHFIPVTKAKMNAHVLALHNLGLLDSSGRLTVLGPGGRLSIHKEIAALIAASGRMSKQALASALHAAFGIRGERGAALVAMLGHLYASFGKAVSTTPGAARQQALFAKTPLQQFEQVWARLQDIGNIMATTVLPDFLAITNMLLRLTNMIDTLFRRHPYLANALFQGALGAAVAGPVGAVTGVTSALLTPHKIRRPHLDTLAPWVRNLLGMGPSKTEVHVTAPLNVTVEGSMLGDYASLSMFLSDWWHKHSAEVGASVAHQIKATQTHHKRATFLDPAYGFLPP